MDDLGVISHISGNLQEWMEIGAAIWKIYVRYKDDILHVPPSYVALYGTVPPLWVLEMTLEESCKSVPNKAQQGRGELEDTEVGQFT